MNLLETATRLLNSGNRALIIEGQPGTGKTRLAFRLTCAILGISPRDLSSHRYEPVGIAHESGCWEVLQFHPGYTYETFIGFDKPGAKDNAAAQQPRRGVIQGFCKKATELRNLLNQRHHDRKFILIIRNINRVDVADVFGELLMAMRCRGQLITTPHTRSLVLPDNVYIIATADTMNGGMAAHTEPFTPAVYETFKFISLEADIESLKGRLSAWGVPEGEATDFCLRAAILNESLGKLTGGNVIGQEFYYRVTDFLTRPSASVPTPDNHIDSAARSLLWHSTLQPYLRTFSASIPAALGASFTD